jgi:hypothetical protein
MKKAGRKPGFFPIGPIRRPQRCDCSSGGRSLSSADFSPANGFRPRSYDG